VVRDALEKRLRESLDREKAEWFSQAVKRAGPGTVDDLLHIYTEASRFLGRASMVNGGAPEAASDVPSHWTLEDAGRLLFLLARHAHAKDAGQAAADATACYEQGDTREQQSWMRGVALLPDAGQYLPLVVDACRTNILPLFEAVACDNPYPARYFPERNFNQMVLKALFNNVALARIQRLADRANPELSRMAGDYEAERRAAGRSVPGDIALAMTGGQARRTE
jgi:hypothetical protein